ncbi:CdaR family transcriptional regulator [Arthrobacter sp. ov118]|uniref:PucR family transcriptional regulator n=1 Tax=Arthrobacter sp. ov118 TaxID=1761747 RepID=UPI0008F12484|nr:helix-turn-helix domain-containing protein [Arthrobacter sp. ov118]SFT95513.1 PucR C-terminal helix-turn-helix domain-containing protein [Arthrobacter sp. ov118]
MMFAAADRHALPTLADVARSAGSEILTLVEMPADDRQIVAGSVLYDSTARPVRFPGAVALAIGLSLAGKKRLGAKVRELSGAGYVAIVYKTKSAPDEALRAAARDNGMALFRASDSVPWNQLAEIMDAAVMPHRRSGRTLVDIRPGDLFDLANTVAAQAGGAIAIADPEQTILAYSTLPDQPIDETRRNSILSLHVPHSVETDNDYRRVHAATDALEVATQDPLLRRTAIAIRAGDSVLGSLWLLERADHHNEDADRILREAANVAALHILHKRTTYVSNLTRQIDLVQPLLFDPKRAELAAIRLGISAPSVRVAALSVWPSEAIAADTLQSRLRLFDTIRTACAIRLPSAVCGFSDNIVYVVLPHTTESSREFQRNAFLKIVQNARRLLSRPVLAALGTPATIDRLEESRVNAELVLSELVRNVAEGRIAADSDDIVADDDSLGSRLQLRQFVSALAAVGQLPGAHALRIAEYDEQHKKSFEETLYAYLSNGGNAMDAAKSLDVHVNTVRYRLSRVQPLFGIDLDDAETRLLVWLQLWARSN